MNKNQKEEPQNKSDILHLLDYCRIDRAAELLECEVSDLLHLEDRGEIDLFWNFNGFPAITRLRSIRYGDGLSVEDMGDQIPSGGYAELICEKSGGVMGETDPDAEIPVLLAGLWEAEDRLPCRSKLLGSLFDRILLYSSSEKWGSVMVEIPINSELPPDSELFITGRDLKRLRKAIQTGEPLEIKDHKQHKVMEDYLTRIGDTEGLRALRARKAGRQESRRAAESYKSCAALVEVLKVLGLNQDDFTGSIPRLKAKLTTRKCTGVLTEIDDKTLIDWLTKAGVR